MDYVYAIANRVPSGLAPTCQRMVDWGRGTPLIRGAKPPWSFRSRDWLRRADQSRTQANLTMPSGLMAQLGAYSGCPAMQEVQAEIKRALHTAGFAEVRI